MPRPRILAVTAVAVVVLLVGAAWALSWAETSDSSAAERAGVATTPHAADRSEDGTTATSIDGPGPTEDQEPTGGPDTDREPGSVADPTTNRDAGAGAAEPDPPLLAACRERRRAALEEALDGGMGLSRAATVLEAYGAAGCIEVCGEMYAPPLDDRCRPR